jgi:lipoate-protein ligase A
MKYLDLTLPTPEENLAADEALLEQAETNGLEVLRVWEAQRPFVVLGLANQLSREVNVAECARRGLPVLRRFSGGGTVVQGPGCLSYALALTIPESGPLTTITETNRFVMETNRRAIEALAGRAVAVRGHTDLEAGGRKFSGNAQRRGRMALLFHGAILYRADLELIGSALAHPSREPDWRAHRSHGEFLGNLAVSREQLIDRLRDAWHARAPLDPAWLNPGIQRLTLRHHEAAWIHRRP